MTNDDPPTSEKEQQEKLRQLESENLRLKTELEARKAISKTGKSVGKALTSSTTRLLAGKGLKRSVRQLLDELPGGSVSKDTISEVITHVIWRLTRIGTFAILAAAAPLLIMTVQTWMLNRQNDKLEVQNRLLGRQNERLDQQINLEEGNRRSSLIFLMSNIMDRIDEELKVNSQGRKLSDPLIGRIVSLSQALRPYRYLENDSLTARQLSPERGQLLFSLINSYLDKETYDKIYERANFNYADLREANFTGAYLRGAKLAHSYFSKANFTNADLGSADLSEALLEEATFRKTRMDDAILTSANLRKSRMENISMLRGNLANADLREIYLRGNFSDTNLDGVKVQNATLADVILEGCYFQSPKWLDSLAHFNLKGLVFVKDIYEPRKEARKQGFLVDTVFVLRTDFNSALARMRACNEAVEAIVESAPRIQNLKKQMKAQGMDLSLYVSKNPFGMEELDIEKDSVYLYRLSADEQDLAGTVLWVQYNPVRQALWELFPEEGKKPAPLDFNRNLLKNMKLDCD
jgi:uncharacterized protein YjbI with pentapeptide repeats